MQPQQHIITQISCENFAYNLLGIIHFRRWHIFMIFDPYPLLPSTINIQAKCPAPLRRRRWLVFGNFATKYTLDTIFTDQTRGVFFLLLW